MMRSLLWSLLVLMATTAVADETVCRGATKYHACSCPIITDLEREAHKDAERISLEQAARLNLEPHEKCGAPAVPEKYDSLRPMTHDGLAACVASFPESARVKAAGVPASAERGLDGRGDPTGAIVVVDVSTGQNSPLRAATDSLRGGEPVTTLVPSYSSTKVIVSSLLKHNVTRGRGAMEHQSPEYLLMTLDFRGATRADCSKIAAAWEALFEAVAPAVVRKIIEANPSGVLVDEVRAGMVPADVEAILGPPERKANLGAKIVYFYPKMKITFVAGKVTDVE